MKRVLGLGPQRAQVCGGFINEVYSLTYNFPLFPMLLLKAFLFSEILGRSSNHPQGVYLPPHPPWSGQHREA